MNSFYEFVEKNKITYPEEMEDMLLNFYFLLKADVMKEINYKVFGEILEFAQTAKQYKNIQK
jgi:hypothetical protein